MNPAKKKNILLGLFVLIGIVIFIAGLFLIGSKNELFKKTFAVRADFANATGLKTGSNVRYNGVKVGIVQSVILINDSVVRVCMQIEENMHGYISATAVASIASDGLMGDKIVNITTDKNSMGTIPITENAFIRSHDPLVMDQAMQTLSVTNENIRVVSENLKKLTNDLNAETGTIHALCKDPDMANDLKYSLSNIKSITSKVSYASDDIQQITSKIKYGEGLAGKLLSDTAAGNTLVYTVNRLRETSDQLHDISGEFSLTMQHVNAGPGTINLLLSDTAFSGHLKHSIVNIESASEKMDEDMEALKHNFLTRAYFRKRSKKKQNTN